MFAALWVPCSSEFSFSSVFVGRFSYLANNFHVTAGAVGSSFFPGSQEIRGKLNFPNMFRKFICSLMRTITRTQCSLPESNGTIEC